MAEMAWAKETLGREANAVECPKCGGFAAEMEIVPKAIKKEALAHDCGRSWMCCTSAFQCKKCGQIVLAHLEAPEME